MKSTATARWDGSVKDGPGKVTAASGLFKNAPYSLKARFEGGAPGTTPEELIAAAHAACYTMALGVGLMKAGLTSKSIETSAEVEVVMGDKGADITGSALKCKVEVPGADAAKVRTIAEGAKTGCPVSKALAGLKITLALDVKV
jgi:osmotically inducible protein OsmC